MSFGIERFLKVWDAPRYLAAVSNTSAFPLIPPDMAMILTSGKSLRSSDYPVIICNSHYFISSSSLQRGSHTTEEKAFFQSGMEQRGFCHAGAMGNADALYLIAINASERFIKLLLT